MTAILNPMVFTHTQAEIEVKGRPDRLKVIDDRIYYI